MKIRNAGQKGGCTMVSVEGRMDALSAPEFETFMSDLINEGVIKVIVNLEDLDYISSAGLRSVLVTTKKIQAKNGIIAIASVHDTVKEIFEISGFNTIIPIYASLNEALKVV